MRTLGEQRRIAVTATVLLLVGTMAGCAEREARPVSTMSPREGRDRVVEFVRDSAGRLDVEGWRPRTGEARPDECGLGDGVKGASYSYDWWAPAGTDVEGDARKVAEYWESLGMRVRVTDTTPRPTVYGEGGPVLRASFDTGAVENQYNIGAVMRCAPGDAEALLLDDNAQRAAGVVLPGDEGAGLDPDPRDPPVQTTPPSSESQG
ncbi:hypothetical protein [Rathayibacter rathayi]|uniref:hypothetical protein n=1 Tax=Rathayibacter rathayi TaxID=33887 RepID=UPI000CE8F866|nr:hypothetical protein [Rathayibacter rathayi]PPG71244.1 hypothetical protein C5C02_02940 [Rathayibacter rathayi]PPG78329.1 hypothetical protein C5C23_02735 [Rathayibacter rathayi]PPI78148.1 hypothetical protein C5E03_01290 [Rathayibacter rathayi]